MDELLALALGLKAADREIQRRMNELLRPHGITAAQAEAIVVIGDAQPLSLKELGELLVAESGHPSRLVDRLVEAGHVDRRAAEDDRRRVELSLTARGVELREHIAKAQQAMFRWGREALADQDVTAAMGAIHALVRGGPLETTLVKRGELARAVSSRGE